MFLVDFSSLSDVCNRSTAPMLFKYYQTILVKMLVYKNIGEKIIGSHTGEENT